jgi:hypothetical protein
MCRELGQRYPLKTGEQIDFPEQTGEFMLIPAWRSCESFQIIWHEVYLAGCGGSLRSKWASKINTVAEFG